MNRFALKLPNGTYVNYRDIVGVSAPILEHIMLNDGLHTYATCTVFAGAHAITTVIGGLGRTVDSRNDLACAEILAEAKREHQKLIDDIWKE